MNLVSIPIKQLRRVSSLQCNKFLLYISECFVIIFHRHEDITTHHICAFKGSVTSLVAKKNRFEISKHSRCGGLDVSKAYGALAFPRERVAGRALYYSPA